MSREKQNCIENFIYAILPEHLKLYRKIIFIQFDILVPNYSEGGYFFKTKQIYIYALIIIEKMKKIFLKFFKSCKISTFDIDFLSSVILHKISTTA